MKMNSMKAAGAIVIAGLAIILGLMMSDPLTYGPPRPHTGYQDPYSSTYTTYTYTISPPLGTMSCPFGYHEIGGWCYRN